MTDKELLELAAKAADEKIDWDNIRDYGSFTAYRLRFENEFWNPLHDDGDALRLAVKLHIAITYPFDEDAVRVWYGHEDTDSIYEPLGSDPYAATRRAMVRAAAELGGKNE